MFTVGGHTYELAEGESRELLVTPDPAGNDVIEIAAGPSCVDRRIEDWFSPGARHYVFARPSPDEYCGNQPRVIVVVTGDLASTG